MDNVTLAIQELQISNVELNRTVSQLTSELIKLDSQSGLLGSNASFLLTFLFGTGILGYFVWYFSKLVSLRDYETDNFLAYFNGTSFILDYFAIPLLLALSITEFFIAMRPALLEVVDISLLNENLFLFAALKMNGAFIPAFFVVIIAFKFSMDFIDKVIDKTGPLEKDTEIPENTKKLLFESSCLSILGCIICYFIIELALILYSTDIIPKDNPFEFIFAFLATIIGSIVSSAFFALGVVRLIIYFMPKKQYQVYLMTGFMFIMVFSQKGSHLLTFSVMQFLFLLIVGTIEALNNDHDVKVITHSGMEKEGKLMSCNKDFIVLMNRLKDLESEKEYRHRTTIPMIEVICIDEDIDKNKDKKSKEEDKKKPSKGD